MRKTSRRRFLRNSIGASFGFTTSDKVGLSLVVPPFDRTQAEPAPNPLPGTLPLTMTGDLAAQMVEGIRQILVQG